MRHVIQTALVFDSSQPEFLLIEYGDDSIARIIGQFHTLKDAFIHAHERVNPFKLVKEPEKRIVLDG